MKSTSLKRNSFHENLYQLDRILRGDATRPEHLKKAEIEIPIVGISVTIICLAVVYGFCMGVFALVRGFENSAYTSALMQTSASMCKVPLLFMLTLLVTFPSLYVFNALAGSKLKMVPVLKLLIASLSVNIAVLASMGPILAFFSLSTPNYSFIVLLNVIVFAVAGIQENGYRWSTSDRCASDSGKSAKAARFYTTYQHVPPQENWSVRFTVEHGLWQFCVANLLLLVGSLLPCRMPDGLGVATVYWQPGSSL